MAKLVSETTWRIETEEADKEALKTLHWSGAFGLSTKFNKGVALKIIKLIEDTRKLLSVRDTKQSASRQWSPKHIMGIYRDVWGLSVTTRNSLARSGKTPDQILEMSKKALMKIKKIGSKHADEIMSKRKRLKD